MSYFRREAKQSGYLADRLPIYIFPALVGSGRILLGMGLAAVTTAILLHTRAAAEPISWWLGVLAYMASVVLVVSGIYAVNVIPPEALKEEGVSSSIEPRPPGPGRPGIEEPLRPPPVAAPPEERQSHLTVLLTEHWGLVSKQELARALTRQANSGRSLTYELARMGVLTDEKLEHVLTVQAADRDPWHDAPKHD